MRRELLDILCHESRNHSAKVEGLVREIIVLQEFPVKNRQEIEKKCVDLKAMSKGFSSFTEDFECRVAENGD
jgi:hypothetical protein